MKITFLGKQKKSNWHCLNKKYHQYQVFISHLDTESFKTSNEFGVKGYLLFILHWLCANEACELLDH